MTIEAAPAVPRERPAEMCDVVMKGGITSGVVYPLAVCELATVYRLRNIGGTSAGAIAAAVAGAAEFGRETGGYDRLSALPAWIGADGNLAKLFQPQKSTRRLFALVMAGVSHTKAKPFWVVMAALRRFWLMALVGALLGIALVVLAVRDGSGVLQVAAIVAGVLLAVVGAAVAIALRLKRVVPRRLGGNKFGLCSGMPGHRSKDPALTPWLADLIDEAATGEKPGPDTDPLTFGELWAGPGGDPVTADPAAAWLRLEMMTTNVTNHRAEKLPGRSRDYFFSPAEFRTLFPERIVRWMIEHAPPLPTADSQRRREEAQRQQLLPLLPLPHPSDLPVIVATRMSLSFPVLLSAVPLWRIDFSKTANQDAAEAWSKWLSENGAEWDAAEDDRKEIAAGLPSVEAERCWFSDGGISSNFPVHFFDAVLPSHPTVGLNLRPFHPDHPRSADETQNVWMPDRHNAGRLDWWYRFDGDVAGFLGNVVRTMQNRVDDAQMRNPGTRDRVAHVSLTKTEGGLNLTMERPVIEALTARGRAAGRLLTDRFSQPPADPGDLGWDDHRWLRLRIALLAASEALTRFAGDYARASDAGGTPYADLLAGPAPPHPTGHGMTAQQRAKAAALVQKLEQLVAAVDPMAGDLAQNAPRPPQWFRIVADDPAPTPKLPPP
ncbi:MAG TPA: hypothetical protein VFX51_20155 [Solirubrobacteraceae bacterium]|nr:hypothetical protein [Solirubrobacteraceae bacterium]